MTLNRSSIRGPMLAALVIAAAAGSAGPGHAQTTQDIQSKTKPQIAAVQARKSERSAAQQKMSSHLLDALKQSSTGVVAAEAPLLVQGPLTKTDEGVLVDITAQVNPELLDQIQQLGGRVVNQHPAFNAIRASMPLEKVEALAAREDVRQVVPAVKARRNSLASEGAVAHGIDLVRTKFLAQGEGVTVGVISDSIDNGFGALANSAQRGGIDPENLSVLPDQEGYGEGEGLAMAEIVHAMAPRAKIIFATGYGGPAQMAANILDLAAAGCKVIVDDLTYFNESPFQDGPIAQAVRAVSSKGVLYFSSARNSGSKMAGTSGTWEGDFEDGGPAGAAFDVDGRIHIFDKVKRITLNTVDKATPDDRVDLFWSDPLGGSRSSYDLFIVDNKGRVVRSSTTSQNGLQDPYQSVDKIRPGESIVIVKAGNADARFLHLDTGRAVLRIGTEGNVRGHNASGAELAFSVAAVRVPAPPALFSNTGKPIVETFSSDGPRRVFYETDGSPITPGNLLASGGKLLRKPDIAAANGVKTTLPGGGLNPFFGTSAAAPHAAGVAAVLLSCASKPSPHQVKDTLLGSALALDATVPSPNTGMGLVMGLSAADRLCQQSIASQ